VWREHRERVRTSIVGAENTFRYGKDVYRLYIHFDTAGIHIFTNLPDQETEDRLGSEEVIAKEKGGCSSGTLYKAVHSL
jgi:hypothetical protein